MGDTVSLTKMSSSIENALDGMVKRANLVPGYLDRVVYAQYQNAQRERWATENSSPNFTGGIWDRLSPSYAQSKLRKYAAAPGGGSKIMIASGALQQSVIGPGPGHNKIVNDRSIRIYVSGIDYAEYADEARPFSTWSDIFYRGVYGGLKDYLIKNIVRTAR